MTGVRVDLGLAEQIRTVVHGAADAGVLDNVHVMAADLTGGTRLRLGQIGGLLIVPVLEGFGRGHGRPTPGQVLDRIRLRIMGGRAVGDRRLSAGF